MGGGSEAKVPDPICSYNCRFDCLRNQILVSVRFRGLPLPHVLCNLYNVLYGCGGRDPMLSIRYLSRISVLSSDYPNFSLLHLPSASLNFRGLPFAHGLCNLENILYGRGWKPKSSGRYLSKIEVPIVA